MVQREQTKPDKESDQQDSQHIITALKNATIIQKASSDARTVKIIDIKGNQPYSNPYLDPAYFTNKDSMIDATIRGNLDQLNKFIKASKPQLDPTQVGAEVTSLTGAFIDFKLSAGVSLVVLPNTQLASETNPVKIEELKKQRTAALALTKETAAERDEANGINTSSSTALALIGEGTTANLKAKGVPDAKIQQVNQDMLRAALGAGFSFTDVLSASRELGLIGPGNNPGQEAFARQLTSIAIGDAREMLRRWKSGEDEGESEKEKREKLARLLSLDINTVNAIEDALKTKGVDVVVASLEPHTEVITLLHAGNLKDVVPRLA